MLRAFILSLLTLSLTPFTHAIALIALATTDTCANLVSTPFVIGIINFGTIDACLCASSSAAFILNNPVGQAAAAAVGSVAAQAALNLLIIGSGGAQTCTYPDHAVPFCTAANPCDFSCDSGFIKSGTDCVCPPPLTVCNGVCGIFPACPSSPAKRHLVPYCSNPSRRPCASWTSASHSTRKGWECIDTENDLENCGGCLFPLFRSERPGRDCSSIPHVRNVACILGECQVDSCRKGWEVGPDGDTCVSSSSSMNLKMDTWSIDK